MAGEMSGDELKAVLSNLSEKIEGMHGRENDRMDRWDKFFDRFESVIEKVEQVLCKQMSEETSRSREAVVDIAGQPPSAEVVPDSPPKRRGRGVVIIETLYRWLGITEENGMWLKDMRGNLSTVASIIATMTFQVGLNPPGGVVQNLENGVVDCAAEEVNDKIYACPGESVFGARRDVQYLYFMMFNNIAFFSSLCVCLWLICGLPMNQRFSTWLLAVAMCISLTCLAQTYLFGLVMVTPGENQNLFRMLDASDHAVLAPFILAAIVAFIFLLRLVLLLVYNIFTNRKSKTASKITDPSDETQVNPT